ncbi:NAD(P)-dependent oxidoreductase [Sulfobacillus harzensis]|uniref:D-3-phosphoglycerate dehydrogenase n=1 Tax=Sulfobacillus harzensis TaxID=2729629 RepID=A0A7Y0Q301_9FIRM|nr:NAD(P)-dependent oxidoreductase [Sulfobacillus harzensis]NMP21694.1 phosphoglycerate dehydrogenase [Sulfobacillus harzensis]
MTRRRILVTESLGPKGLEYLRERAEVDAYDLLPPEQLPELMGHYDAVIIRSAHRLTRELLANKPRLKVVARAGAGVDNVDLEAATEFGIAVINAPGANAIAAAEHTFALMLATMRNVPSGNDHVRQGGWDRAAFLGRELYEKRLGIIGLGRVGRQVARIAHGFRMPVAAFDPFLATEIFRAHDVEEFTTLDDLLRWAEILTIHTPKSGPKLGLRELSLLPVGAVVMNVARGGLIDEEALAHLLETGRIHAAGVDVFSHEPPQRESPLLRAPHVVVTPHLGGSTHEAMVEVGLMTARGVLQALENQTPSNLVNVPIPDLPDEDLKALDRAMRILGRVFSRLNPKVHGPLVLSVGSSLSSSVIPWLRQAALAAFLDDRLDERVNTINALLVAEQQGLTLLVEESPLRTTASIALRWEGRPESEVAFSIEPQGQVVLRTLAGIPMEMPWPEIALVTRHHDAPGVVGRVGTVVGQYDVNIGQLHLGRRSAGDEAVMVLTLDALPPEELLSALAAQPGIGSVYRFSDA